MMRLAHRTNYWGSWIDSNDSDSDVDFDAIWVQAVNDDEGDCCRGFGNRSVPVVNSDFEREDSDWWSLFRVTGERGMYNSSHYFHKFVAIPQGVYDYGKRGCQKRGWAYIGQFHASTAIEDLEELLDYWLEMDNGDFNHIHIGLWMEVLET